MFFYIFHFFSLSLFRGGASTLQSVAASNFVYFYTFHGLKKLAGAQGKQSAFKDLLFASVAGVFVYPSIYPCVCAYLSICPSVHLFVPVFLSVCLSVLLFICLCLLLLFSWFEEIGGSPRKTECL
jgi:hypothetical protein